MREELERGRIARGENVQVLIEKERGKRSFRHVVQRKAEKLGERERRRGDMKVCVLVCVTSLSCSW